MNMYQSFHIILSINVELVWRKSEVGITLSLKSYYIYHKWSVRVILWCQYNGCFMWKSDIDCYQEIYCYVFINVGLSGHSSSWKHKNIVWLIAALEIFACILGIHSAGKTTQSLHANETQISFGVVSYFNVIHLDIMTFLIYSLLPEASLG